MPKTIDIQNAARLSSKEIFEAIRREGEEELERPTFSLAWSGLAAGILISFSVLGEGIFRTYLPEAQWSYLVENLGYSFGFLLVILGRMQLFTENTITTVLPLSADRRMGQLRSTLRLWSIVLTANVAGAFVAAWFMSLDGLFAPDFLVSVADLSRHATGFEPQIGFLKAIPAGILVAAIVWMMPAQNGGELPLIVLFTWLIAAGDFTHVVAGSVEMWFLVLTGELGFGRALFSFFLPVLAGNIVGGTAVFSILAWAQVREEVEENA